MTKQNITAWFFEGGMVGVPRNLLGLMEPLGLNFEDLGKILYLLYCGTDQIKKKDRYAISAAKSLHSKGLINWFVDQETIDFSPMFDRINSNLGEEPVYVEQKGFSTEELNYSDLLKKFEREQGRFLSAKEKQEIMDAVQRYNWSYDLVHEIYSFYYKNYRRHSYDFGFFCKMAFGAKVDSKAGFGRFVDNLEHSNTKVVEVLKRLGKHNNPTEAQKEMYLKWANLWKFSHEMILAAADDNINADNPSFSYIDAILNDWREQGIDTVEKMRAHKAKHLEDKQQKGQIAKIKRVAPQENFESTPRDLSFLVE